ncbi:MAG: ABC transporter ATP-binding protein [Dorea sp.]|nr:ABC transporter ATP-binding protein [Dorea sp.]
MKKRGMGFYVRKVMPFIIFQIAADFVCTLLASMYPYLQKLLFDSDQKLTVIFWYAVFHVLDVLINYVGMRATFAQGIGIERAMKHDFFKSVVRQPKKEFVKHDIGTYLSWQSNDLAAVEMDYVQPMVDIVRSINMFLIYGVVIFGLVDWRIGLVLFLSSIVTVAGPKLFGDKMASARSVHQEKIAEYTGVVKDLLEGFALVNSRTRRQFIGVQDEKLEEMCGKRRLYGKAKSASIAVNDMAVRVIRIASFAAAGILLAKGEITIGTCVATFGYVDSFLSPIQSILYDVSAIQSVAEVKRKVMDFLAEREPDGREKAEGEVLIDGVPLAKLDVSELVSCVHQGEHVFRAGFWDNVTVFGAYPDDLLCELKTRLGNPVLDAVAGRTEVDNCQDMSGGERQTLGFLRMLLAHTQIILMDEPFSAVDPFTREVYLDYLLKEMDSETTLIMVTHDLSERLKEFDEVIWMEHGGIKKDFIS